MDKLHFKKIFYIFETPLTGIWGCAILIYAPKINGFLNKKIHISGSFVP